MEQRIDPLGVVGRFGGAVEPWGPEITDGRAMSLPLLITHLLPSPVPLLFLLSAQALSP